MNQKYIVQVDDLKLVFEDGTQFSFADINIAKGKITGIIGPNGSGKTTFVEAVLDLKKPQIAKIWIDGKTQKDFFSEAKNRQNLGSQLQVFAFSETIKVSEMVALHKALYNQQSTRVYDDLALAEISSKRLDKLSGGQKQRVNLFMALAHLPSFITLDEPSAALDKTMAETLISLLKYIVTNEGCSIMLVTHHPYELDICDEIMTIYGGTNTYLETRKDFIENIIGSHHAQIFIGENDDAAAIETQIKHIADVKQHFRQNGHVDIFGNGNMEGDFLALVKRHNLKSYSFAHTNSADILKISTSYAS
ncbi:MAG: ABC transporter ATP-binding protein [Rhizobiales bacterium]|nr:ATP-binding cassette domain-containing protein [Hyphomicrobiales bacterium]NRB15358.1 ABC transporter ATP-binding protein [Hyphomicrobiales bacterium]